MRVLRAATIAGLCTAALSLGVSSLGGQQDLPIGGAGPALVLEITKPFTSRDGPFADASFSTTAWDASVTYPLASGPTLFARMGLLYASIEGFDASLALANPRVGAMIGSERGRRGELHVDLPLADVFGDPYAAGIGIFSDYEELERFTADAWALGASASAQVEAGPDAFLGARLGSTLLLPEGEGSDLFALVSVFGDAPTDRTRFRIEFSSLTRATGSDVTFSDRSTFFASLGVTWPFTRFSPTLFVRAPIDNTLDGTVPIVAGARMRFGG
jgi:hypothetical protein